MYLHKQAGHLYLHKQAGHLYLRLHKQALHLYLRLHRGGGDIILIITLWHRFVANFITLHFPNSSLPTLAGVFIWREVIIVQPSNSWRLHIRRSSLSSLKLAPLYRERSSLSNIKAGAFMHWGAAIYAITHGTWRHHQNIHLNFLNTNN